MRDMGKQCGPRSDAPNTASDLGQTVALNTVF